MARKSSSQRRGGDSTAGYTSGCAVQVSDLLAVFLPPGLRVSSSRLDLARSWGQDRNKHQESICEDSKTEIVAVSSESINPGSDSMGPSRKRNCMGPLGDRKASNNTSCQFHRTESVVQSNDRAKSSQLEKKSRWTAESNTRTMM